MPKRLVKIQRAQVVSFKRAPTADNIQQDDRLIGDALDQ